MNKLVSDIHIRTVKIFDIGYITSIYFVLGIFFAKCFDKLYGTFNEKSEKKKSMLIRTFELIGMMWISGIVIYIIKNIVELIPSPFNGLYGFDHLRVIELKNGAVFTFIFLLVQSHFTMKLSSYYTSLSIL
jgi:hypothetical protein